jgi:uncharacterized membrane protein YedE/YeeE
VPGELLAVGLWLALGTISGAVVQRTHFCLMGALADLLVMGSRHRLRAWAAAIAGAAATAGLATAAGLAAPRLPTPALAAAVLGGLGFGFGMVLAGGCLLRNLVRLGAGSVRALIVLAVALASGLVVSWLIPAASPGGLDRGGPWPALAVAVAAAAIALSGGSRAGSVPERAGGLVLGMAAGLALVLPPLGGVGMNAWAALAALPGIAPSTGPVLALLPGLVLGAGLVAWRRGTWRIERFVDGADRARHLVGALLMGSGAALAGGCSFAHGIGGVAVLAPASVATTLAIVAGAAWALRFLETGGLLTGLAALLRPRGA